MEPTENYEIDCRLIFFRLEKLELAAEQALKEHGAIEVEKNKLQQDLNVAHGRIRDLQQRGWISSGVVGFLTVMVIELIKFILHK